MHLHLLCDVCAGEPRDDPLHPHEMYTFTLSMHAFTPCLCDECVTTGKAGTYVGTHDVFAFSQHRSWLGHLGVLFGKRRTARRRPVPGGSRSDERRFSRDAHAWSTNAQCFVDFHTICGNTCMPVDCITHQLSTFVSTERLSSLAVTTSCSPTNTYSFRLAVASASTMDCWSRLPALELVKFWRICAEGASKAEGHAACKVTRQIVWHGYTCTHAHCGTSVFACKCS